MNIFYLHQDPKLAAQYHCDKHVVKMILESAQLLCTAVNVLAGEQVTPYKSTHVNHPCSIWVRESFDNWAYTASLMLELEKEWNYRYNHTKKHASVVALSNPELDLAGKAFKYLPHIGLTTPALAMPDHCKPEVMPDNLETALAFAVCAYREYYRKEKVALHKWTNREVPFWI